MPDPTTTAPPLQQPAVYTRELAELIRAQRLYTGLSQRGMAKHLDDMDRRTYQRLESGQENAWPGFYDDVLALVDQFDKEVDHVVAATDKQLTAAADGARVHLRAPTEPREEWQRCVVARAAVLSGRILPVPTPA